MFNPDSPHRVKVSSFGVKTPRGRRLAEFSAIHDLGNRVYVFNHPEDAARFLSACGYDRFVRTEGDTVFYANAEGKEAHFCVWS